jgi:hypothetical protein
MTVVGLWLAGWLVGAEAVVVGESEQSWVRIMYAREAAGADSISLSRR